MIGALRPDEAETQRLREQEIPAQPYNFLRARILATTFWSYKEVRRSHYRTATAPRGLRSTRYVLYILSRRRGRHIAQPQEYMHDSGMECLAAGVGTRRPCVGMFCGHGSTTSLL